MLCNTAWAENGMTSYRFSKLDIEIVNGNGITINCLRNYFIETAQNESYLFNIVT